MGTGRGMRGFVVLVGGVLAAGAVQAGTARALSDDEMAEVWGRGLDTSTLEVLTRQDQSASYASADGAFTALATLTADGAATLERQTARQQAQSATVGLQQTLRLPSRWRRQRSWWRRWRVSCCRGCRSPSSACPCRRRWAAAATARSTEGVSGGALNSGAGLQT